MAARTPRPPGLGRTVERGEAPGRRPVGLPSFLALPLTQAADARVPDITPEATLRPFRLLALVKTAVEPLEGNKVKLSVEVDQVEFENALAAAFRRMAREVKVPGFRPGKVPRRVLEARIGKDAARQEALREALPDYYAQAVREQDVDPIAPPEIDITADGAEGPVCFDAVVEVRPAVAIPGYSGLQVTIPSLEVTDSDIDAQVDRLRDTFAELRAVERPAQDGDHVTIDISGTRAGQRQEDLSTEDFLYEVGSGTVVPQLDEQLRGAKVGDILTFDAPAGEGDLASFRVLVKDVKEKVLPEISDDWASEASEFDTVDELRADLRTRLEAVRRVQGQMSLREGALQALVGLVSDDAPEPLVNAEMERRLHDLGHRLEAQGANFAQYLAALGKGQDEFVEELRSTAVDSTKADLALRALADAEGLEVDDDEIQEEIERLAARYGGTPAELTRQLEESDGLADLRIDLRKGKAIQWLVEHVDLVDEEGRAVDRALLEGQPADREDEAGDEPEARPEDEETIAEVPS